MKYYCILMANTNMYGISRKCLDKSGSKFDNKILPIYDR